MATATKLSARDLIGYAIDAIFRHFGTLLGLCAPSLLIVIAAAVVGRILFPPAAEPNGASDFAGPLPYIVMLATLVANVALIPAFTGWHRLLILGDARRENGRAYGWDRREWRYFGVLFGIWCLMFLVNVIANLLVIVTGAGVAAVAISLAVIAIYLGIWAHLGLALPAAALGGRPKLAEIGKLVEGNAGKIALGLGAVWLLLGVAGAVIVFVLTYATSSIGSVFLVFIFAMLFYYLGLVASVGVLSRAYAQLAAPRT